MGSFPIEALKHECLKSLELARNKISELPEEGWEEAKNLEIIKLESNPIEKVPGKMLSEGSFHLLNL